MLQKIENLPPVVRDARRFVPEDSSKKTIVKWKNPENWQMASEIQGNKGFILTDSRLCCFDFDHVLDDAGQFVTDEAEAGFLFVTEALKVDESSRPYVELSSSGKGLHVLARCQWSGQFNLKLGQDAHLEVFANCAKKMTLTGNKYKDAGEYLGDSDSILADLQGQRHKEIARNQNYDNDADRARRMLDFIEPASLSYGEWVQVGMALLSCGCTCEDWDTWSARDPRHKPKDCINRWKGFRAAGITIASLHRLAKAGGYQEPRREKPSAIMNSAGEFVPPAKEVDWGGGQIDDFLHVVQTRVYEPMRTGVEPFDRLLGGGLMRQQVVFIGAAPGLGKTSMCQWFTETMIRNTQDAACIFCNLEMAKEQLLARSLSRRLAGEGKRIPVSRILRGYEWTDEERETITSAAHSFKETIGGRLLYNPWDATTNLDDILRNMEHAAKQQEQKGKPAPLVVLDYLQLLTGEAREDAQAVIKRAVAGLKGYCVEHNAAAIVVVAHNRTANSTGNPGMGAARDSSAIEYTADCQLVLDYTASIDGGMKPDEAANNEEERKRRTLKTVKARFVEPGRRADFIFDGATSTFSPVANVFGGRSLTRKEALIANAVQRLR